MKNAKIQRWLNTILISFTLILIGTEIVLLVNPVGTDRAAAQEGTDATGAPSETVAPLEEFTRDVSSKCANHIKNFAFHEQKKFAEFMNAHFRSEKPTSELITATIERFRQYRKDMRDEMERFLPSDKTATQSANAERAACERALTEDFTLMKQLITQHITENAYAKKSTRLLDKYKELNTKLDRLNFTIGQIAGYFGSFAQRLPCYATKCVKS